MLSRSCEFIDYISQVSSRLTALIDKGALNAFKRGQNNINSSCYSKNLLDE